MEEGISVDLFWAEGRYFAEVTPEPKEVDNTFDLTGDIPYTNFLYYSTVNFLLSSMEVDIILSHDIYSSGL